MLQMKEKISLRKFNTKKSKIAKPKPFIVHLSWLSSIFRHVTSSLVHFFEDDINLLGKCFAVLQEWEFELSLPLINSFCGLICYNNTCMRLKHQISKLKTCVSRYISIRFAPCSCFKLAVNRLPTSVIFSSPEYSQPTLLTSDKIQLAPLPGLFVVVVVRVFFYPITQLGACL